MTECAKLFLVHDLNDSLQSLIASLPLISWAETDSSMSVFYSGELAHSIWSKPLITLYI